jgi:hypothetical protein
MTRISRELRLKRKANPVLKKLQNFLSIIS